MEDVTTPLRLEEYSGYKLNMDNNSSVEHRADSSMVMDEDAPHSPYRYVNLRYFIVRIKKPGRIIRHYVLHLLKY